MQKIYVSIKGGKGSGFRGHAGRPGKRGGSSKIAAASQHANSRYKVLDSAHGAYSTIEIVEAGKRIDRDTERVLKASERESKANYEEDSWIAAIYNAVTKMWHVATTIGIDHDAFQKEAIADANEEDTGKASYYPIERVLEVYDLTEAKFWGSGADPARENRLSKTARKTLQAALSNPFADSNGKLKTRILPKRKLLFW